MTDSEKPPTKLSRRERRRRDKQAKKRQPEEPTAGQIGQLGELESEAYAGELPAKPLPITDPPPTLQGCLDQARDVLRVVAGQRRDAEAARETAEAERQRAAAIRSQLEGEFAQRHEEVQRAERALASRREQLDALASSVEKERAALTSDRAALADQSNALQVREREAREGFLAERARILEPLQSELAQLEEDRTRLTLEIAERHAEAAAARAQADIDAAAARAEAEAQLAHEHAERRRQLDAEIADERQSQLAKLRHELQAHREQAEQALEAEAEQSRRTIEAEAQALAEEQASLDEARKALRQRESVLALDQEELAEDRQALAAKVDRLVERETEKLRHELESTQRQLTDARRDRDAHFQELESIRTLNRQFGERTPAEILQALREAERKRDELQQTLRERPDSNAAARLAELEAERSRWLDERAVLQADLANARSELGTRRLAAIELETHRKEKEALTAQSQVLSTALDELKTRVEDLTRQDEHRNPMTALAGLDEDEELQSEVRTVSPLSRSLPSLAAFANDLKHRIALGIEDRVLYYSDRDVRSFLGGLAMTPLLLLQGISGTGKTSLPVAFANAVGGAFEIIEVQAGWRDRQDLLGYYNAFHRHYYATNFLQALYRAGTPKYRDRPFIIVLDEMNLSRPEQFFADFISVMEQPRGRQRITLLNDPLSTAPALMVDGRHLPIPPNVWFVGTANHDETTAEFADKTYDRAHVMEMPRKTADAHFKVDPNKRDRAPISYGKLEEAFAAARTKRGAEIRHALDWLQKEAFVGQLGKRFRVGWGNRLEHQLERYLPVVIEAGGSIGEAVDHLLETKVLRKLRDRHDVRAAALEKLQDDLFEAGERLDPRNLLERCNALLEGEIASKRDEDLV